MRTRQQLRDRGTPGPTRTPAGPGREGEGPGRDGGPLRGAPGAGAAQRHGNGAVIDLVERRGMAEEAVRGGEPTVELEAAAMAEAAAAKAAFGLGGVPGADRMAARLEEETEEGSGEEEEAPRTAGPEEAPVEEAAPPADGEGAPEAAPPAGPPPVDGAGGPPPAALPPRPPAGGDGGGAPTHRGGSVEPVSGPTMGSPAPAHDALVTDIWAFVHGATPQEQSGYAQSRLSTLAAVARANQTELDIHARDVGGQIDAMVAERVGRVDSAFDTALGELRGRFAEVRGRVEGALDAAASQIGTDVQSALGAIDQSLNTRLGEVGTGFDGALAQVEGIKSEGVSAFTAAWQERVDAIRQAGETKSQQALNMATTLGSAWQGGDGIEGERNEARRQAASEVGQKYAEEIRNKATQAADELAGGMGNISEMVNQMVQPVPDALADQRSQAETALRDAAAGARSEVEKQAETARQSLDELRGTIGGELDNQEQASVDSLEGARQTARSGLEAAGERIKAEIEGATQELETAYGGLMEQANNVLAEGDAPFRPHVDGALAEIQAELDAIKAEQLANIDQAAQGAMGDLDGKLDEGLAGVQSALEQQLAAADQAGETAMSSVTELSTGFSQGLVDMTSQFDTALGEQATQAVQAAEQTLTDTRTALSETQGQYMVDLDSARDNVLGELDTALGKCESDARSKAEEAAAQIQEKSWWEKAWDVVASIASFLANIAVGLIVFVAVAAFCIATFGAGPLALIAAGAIAGAVAAVSGKFAGDAVKSLLTLSNQFGSWQSYLQTAVIGAVGGAIFGAFANTTMKIIPAITGAFGTSLADQVTDILIFGEGWNWGEFLITGALSFGLGWALGKIPKLKELGNSLTNRLFPPDARGNNWNGFQRFCKETPLLRNLTTRQRADLWSNVVTRKVSGTPKDIVNGLIKLALPSADTDKSKGSSHVDKVADVVPGHVDGADANRD